MKRLLYLPILLSVLWPGLVQRCTAQELCKVCPVTLLSSTPPHGQAFILTTLDDNLYKRKPLSYSSAIEIIDADAPWPPRWFALHPTDTGAALRPGMMLMMNASMDPALHYLTVAQTALARFEPVVITCDQHMQARDTFTAYRHIMDSHDFAMDRHGGVIYFATHDTTVDLRAAYGDPGEVLVPMEYQSIEIADSNGRSVFSWNPLYQLGFDAMYLPYRYAKGLRSNHARFDWSHGNSVHLDTDGDILYSFKHIGIGKISRTDGHVIWRIDRNRQRINAESDSLPIFLQHDLQAVPGADGRTYYTVLSNGDSAHPQCRGYQFTVSPGKGGPVVKLVKTFQPQSTIPNTGGGGNLDLAGDGSYLMNYGLFPIDTAEHTRPLMEYHQGGVAATYSIPPSIFSFRAHSARGAIPERPQIQQHGAVLSVSGTPQDCKWYKLSGRELKEVKMVARGNLYTPGAAGFYCVAVPYGVGWSVSAPFVYIKK